MVQDQIEREVVIEAPVDRVWQLLTEAEHLGTWFGDAGAEIDLRPGGELVMRWREYGTSYARVERVEPNRRFAFRWVPGATGNDAKPTAGNSTVVEFTLAEQGGATVLKVVESGFAGLEQPDPERIFAGNVEGWASELGELAGYATKVAA
jgi:uncharacterized protein YndB with AHSA1/START domain